MFREIRKLWHNRRLAAYSAELDSVNENLSECSYEDVYALEDKMFIKQRIEHHKEKLKNM